MFDPYEEWLGLAKGQRPPTYYQLLDISPKEKDSDAITEAAGLTHGAFYSQFDSKEAVVAEALRLVLDESRDLWARDLPLAVYQRIFRDNALAFFGVSH